MNLNPVCSIHYKLEYHPPPPFSSFTLLCQLPLPSYLSLSPSLSPHTQLPPPMLRNLLCYWVSVTEDELALAFVLTPGLAGHV